MVDRRPLFPNGQTTGHYYDEDVSRTEKVGSARIVWHINKNILKPRVWFIGVVAPHGATNAESWVGGITNRNTRWYIGLRGNQPDFQSFEFKGAKSEAEALEILRWAILRMFP